MSEGPEFIDGRPNISGWEREREEATRRGRDRAIFLHESEIDFGRGPDTRGCPNRLERIVGAPTCCIHFGGRHKFVPLRIPLRIVFHPTFRAASSRFRAGTVFRRSA